MQRIFRVTNLPAAISLLVVAMIWIFAEAQNQRVHEQKMREEVLGSTSLLRARIEGALTSNIQLVRGMIATIVTEPDMSGERFMALSAGLIGEDSLIRNMAAAPDLVIRYIYPLEENAAAIGLNYLENPLQREGALLARDSGMLVIAGPVNLVQGGLGFIGRFPVFIPDGSERGRFWGIVSAVIDVDRFYAATGLLDPDLPVRVALSGHDASGPDGGLFFGDAAILDDDPVQMPITLPFGTWQLWAIPRDGWQHNPPNVWLLRLGLLAGAALIIIPGVIMGRLLDERARNVSRLHLALRRQGETNARFENVSRISRTWVWEQDAERRLTYLSSGYQHITGFHRQHLLGQRMIDLVRNFPKVMSSADWAWLEDRIASHQPFSDFICLAATRNGDEIWVQLSGTPVFDETGTFRGYRGAGMDVTTFQQARQAADEANRMKSMFLANMSHEIRTPLNGVLGMAQVLESMIADPEHRHMVTTIRESGQSLQNILNDILDLSKIEAGKLELENTPFQPEITVGRIADLHRLRAEEKGLTLSVHGLAPPGTARWGDGHRFAQVLHNLLGNAIKFTDTGQVTVEVVNQTGQALVVRISDTGSGMSDEQLRRLFDEFVQGDDSVARRHGGTGLGMSIVRRLVNMMQGELHVRSSLGEGTTITISLPLPATEMISNEVPETGLELDLDLAGMRLLAADDNRTNRRVLEALLRDTGIELTMVEDGQKAVEAWREGDYELILLDISMPVLGGVDARRQIVQEATLAGRPPPPAIAFTANVMAHQVSEYLAEGFVSCIGKPLKKSALLHALKAARRNETTAPTS
ncbi:MAG: ATP-binding protein [Pararhodobacter sp.]